MESIPVILERECQLITSPKIFPEIDTCKMKIINLKKERPDS